MSHCIVLCNQLCCSLISSPKPYLGWESERKSTCEGWWEQAAWLRWVPVHHPALPDSLDLFRHLQEPRLPLGWAKFSCKDGDGSSCGGVWLFWAAPDAGAFSCSWFEVTAQKKRLQVGISWCRNEQKRGGTMLTLVLQWLRGLGAVPLAAGCAVTRDGTRSIPLCP